MDLRNLDQIREREDGAPTLRLGPWLLGALGIGALVLTAVMSMPEKHVAAESSVDPLSALLAKAKERQALPADQLGQEHASFPQMLSDIEPATTAMVTVRSREAQQLQGSPVAPALADASPYAMDDQSGLPPAPPPGDELPVVPLPAGKLLDATRLTAGPQDRLAGLAADRSQAPPNGARAESGAPGDFQIQVASFRDQPEADAYVQELRLRGHPAYSQAARVPNRGLWHRVRIGPFKDKAKALAYKAEFEAKEGMAAFFVDPDKVEQRETQRAAQVAARAKAKR